MYSHKENVFSQKTVRIYFLRTCVKTEHETNSNKDYMHISQRLMLTYNIFLNAESTTILTFS